MTIMMEGDLGFINLHALMARAVIGDGGLPKPIVAAIIRPLTCLRTFARLCNANIAMKMLLTLSLLLSRLEANGLRVLALRFPMSNLRANAALMDARLILGAATSCGGL